MPSPTPAPVEGEDSIGLDGFLARISNDGRRVATFLIDASRRKKELDADLLYGLHLILRREGRLDLHAAAVVPEPGLGAILLMGPKGAGKSSLTIAAALRGWRFLSDDNVVAWGAEDRLRIAGLRVPLFLTPDAAERLPAHLPKGQPVPSMGKRMFHPEQLFPGQLLPEGEIAATVFPERTPVLPSALQRLRPVDCFQRLLSLSPFLASDPSARPCLAVARAIADLPSFVLRAGADILEPRAAERILRAALS